MASTQIELLGQTEYDERFPPRDARKGYVARITGRAAGAVKYQREFLGKEVTLLAGDEGLYERQIGERKGGFTRHYNVVLSHPEHGLIRSVSCENELPKIAKLLDDGVSIQDAVEVTNMRPSKQTEGLMVFDAVARTKTEAKKAAVCVTIEAAVEVCWQALATLPEKEAKKVLAALKIRLAPPTTEQAPVVTEVPTVSEPAQV